MRNISFIMCLMLLIGSQLKSQNIVQITLQDAHIEIGDYVHFPVRISTSGLPIGTYSIQVEYDDSVVRLYNYNGANSWSTICNINDSGVAKISGVNTTGQSTDFIAVTLSFEVIGVPGQVSPMDLVLKKLTDPMGIDLQYQHTNGHIAIECYATSHIGNPDFTTIDKGIFRANQFLSSDVIIDGTTDPIQFRTGDVILLEPSFEVRHGSTFHALIQDCFDLTPAFKRDLENSELLKLDSDELIRKNNSLKQDDHNDKSKLEAVSPKKPILGSPIKMIDQ